MEITPTSILAILVILFALVNILQTFWAQKSVPLDKVKELVAELSVSANQTVSPADNRVVELLEMLLDFYIEDSLPDDEEVPTPTPQAIVTFTNNAPLG